MLGCELHGFRETEKGYQQQTLWVGIANTNQKLMLQAAAIALYMLYADNEPSAEVYGAATDRQQASIVSDVAKQMVEMSPALMERSKLMIATKRIVNYGNCKRIDNGNYRNGSRAY